MLQRIVDLCRNLVGGPARAGEPGEPPDDERRVWVRYASSLETTVAAVSNGSGPPLAALVRNVSRGGISLIVYHAFTPGDLVVIDLPSGTVGASDTILACVVHTTPISEEAWSIGCVFAEELTNDELAAVGARRVKAPKSDNRNFVRFACNIQATYQRVDEPEDSTAPAEVVNISATGIGLVLDRPLAPGALLSLHLRHATSAAARTVLACVVHVVTRPDGKSVLGCNFIRELAERDLKALLAESAPSPGK
jgi:hypothetical protein